MFEFKGRVLGTKEPPSALGSEANFGMVKNAFQKAKGGLGNKLLKYKFVALLENGDVWMIEPCDLSCEGIEVLGLHVEDEDGNIEVTDLFELLPKHGWGQVPRELCQLAQSIGEGGFYEYRLEALLLPGLLPYPGRCTGVPRVENCPISILQFVAHRFHHMVGLKGINHQPIHFKAFARDYGAEPHNGVFLIRNSGKIRGKKVVKVMGLQDVQDSGGAINIHGS
jgi:hypothetical protein